MNKNRYKIWMAQGVVILATMVVFFTLFVRRKALVMGGESVDFLVVAVAVVFVASIFIAVIALLFAFVFAFSSTITAIAAAVSAVLVGTCFTSTDHNDLFFYLSAVFYVITLILIDSKATFKKPSESQPAWVFHSYWAEMALIFFLTLVWG